MTAHLCTFTSPFLWARQPLAPRGSSDLALEADQAGAHVIQLLWALNLPTWVHIPHLILLNKPGQVP